jgi:adenylate cyclase
MYRLSFVDGSTPREYTFSDGEVLLGRSPDCQVILNDFSISRNHAKIIADAQGPRLVDLKSKNGTQVNGVQIVEAPLKDGDRILLGTLQFTFAKALDAHVVLDEAKPLSEEAGTIIRSVGEISQLLQTQPPSEPGGERRTADRRKAPSELREIERTNRILTVLTDFSRELLTLRPVDELLEQVMSIVFDHVPADRGFLMLYDGTSEKLVPKVVKYRDPKPGASQGQISISKTIAERVFKERLAILTSDAQVDPRFGAGDSIRFHGIRSAMCAPLWNNDRAIGIIHVDSPMLTNCFTPNDLDLLCALANHAAVAVEHARLNETIRAEERKRERLSRFLSPQVTQRVLAASDAQSAVLGAPEVREVSVLFADIVGFTTMSEKMSPAAVALLLNDYLSRMTDAVFKYEGTLDKYIGDAVMAVFGAPIDMPDHAERSVRCAIEMHERLEESNQERRDGPKLRIRIGVNTGRAVAGEIGSIVKTEYTVLGDTVNTAARLQSSVALPGTIAIGPNTYEAVKHIAQCRCLGPQALKGKEQVVTAYLVEKLIAKSTPGGEA